MTQDLNNSVVGIPDNEGMIRGTGFVIADKALVTCAHVIRDIGVEPGGSVTVIFSSLNRFEYLTEVLVQGYSPNNDLAILIGNQPLPAGTVRLELCSPVVIRKPTDFQTVGYRYLGDREGIPAHGTLVGRVSAELGPNPPSHPSLILESQQIDEGMSGAPLYIPAIDRVAGIIKAYWDSKGKIKDANTVRAIPSEAIVETWPRLSLRSMKTESLETQILRILYDYQQSNFGEPEMKFNDLTKVSGASEDEVRRCIFGLKGKRERWVDYEMTPEGDKGLVWLTPRGLRVAEDA